MKTTKIFEPSQWMLEQMIAQAMGKCDADIEQTQAASDAAARRGLGHATSRRVMVLQRCRGI